MADNAFVEIADWPAAQAIADQFSIQALHGDLNALALQYVPFLKQFNFFAAGDLSVLLAILRGEYHISGLSNRLLQRVLTGKMADRSVAS